MAYDIEAVSGIDELRERMANAETDEDWSFILNDHLSFGNNKISKNTAIFNMNAASDCPNKKTRENGESETGYCQVPFEACYAAKAERQYKAPLDYRRRQEYLWDSLDAHTFASAFLYIVQRKRNDVSAIRFSEAGDFRHKGDIIKVDRIAELLKPYGIDVYTYSASHKLDWSEAEHFVVNQSNDRAEYGDRSFRAVNDVSEIPDDGILCPFDAAKMNGVPTEDRPKCGECEACIRPEEEQPRNVYIRIH
jgi:hypothetical protein